MLVSGVVLPVAPRRIWANEVSSGSECEQADDESLVIERDAVEVAPRHGVSLRTVEIENRLGDVTIIGRDEKGLSISVTKRAADEETLERLKVNLQPDPAGSVRISSVVLFGEEARPIPLGAARIDITVSLPREAKVSVKVWNGAVSVSGLSRGATLLANDADITVTDVKGPVATSNLRGRQRLIAVSGDVAADNAHGDLALDEISGQSLAARAHDGTVVATRVRSRRVEIRTTFGSILFQGELLAGGRYDLRSYRGNVEARLPRDTAFVISASSRDGTVASRLDLRDAQSQRVGEGLSSVAGYYGPAHGSRLGPVERRPAVIVITSVVGTVTVGLVNE
ncbi:MAG: DUF4097 family beta strand repeat-containing protein [Pseudomonadota bacterium]